MADKNISFDGKAEFDRLNNRVDYVTYILLAVVVVMFASFIALMFVVLQMVNDSYRNKQTDYQRLTDQIISQNKELNDLRQITGH